MRISGIVEGGKHIGRTLGFPTANIAPDAGSVLLDGADITALPPEKRDVNTVFQSYALFPQVATKFFEERRGKSSDAPEADVTRELYVEDLTE